MRQRHRIDRAARAMLIFAGWSLVLCCVLMLLFSTGLFELVLLLLSIGLLCFFYWL